ncbi:MAG: M1 family aminopeptidase [Ferruginibacter sp.]
MRTCIFLLLSFIFSENIFAQVNEDDPGCRDKCSHGFLSSRPEQVDYYQYPSLDKYDVKYLKLNLAIETGSRFISGTALTVVKAVQPLDSFVTELRSNMIVDSVFINGVKMNFQRGSDHVFIPLPAILPIGTDVTALFYYNGTASSGAVFAGTIASNGLSYAASVSESYQAREWFPVKQVLRDKFDSADIWIKTDQNNKVGSNGLLVAIVDSPNNKKQYQWRSRYPMNYYLPSFSVGNYMEYRNYAKPAAMAPDSILVQHYVANDETYLASIKANLDKTPAFIEKFSELYGLYPFKNEKYGHSQANIGGGMEHQTMTTTSSFGSTLIAHELGHQWFGDNVTCATWNHIWLNEGFASYSEYLAIEKLPLLFPTTTPAAYMQSIHTNVMSQATGSVYVPDPSIFDENRIFSGRLTYNKGSAIIHNLRFEMQDDNLFFQTLKNYQQQYKNSTATADEFRVVAETTSGKNFTDFFNQWYYGEGYPTINITYIRETPDSVILIVNETVSAPAITPFFKGLYEFTITSAQGDTTVKAYVTSNNQQFKFSYHKTPNGVIVDPNNWVLNATGTITNGGTIPVKLLSFEGTSNSNCTIQLKWKTTNEQNILNYEIEHSNDGSNFTRTGTVSSRNNNSETLYQYNYNAGTGIVHYFRLKITETNGNYSYSGVITVTRKCMGSFAIDLAPNPVTGTGKLYVTINQPIAGNTTIRIFDPTGALIYKDTKRLLAGENHIPLDIVQKIPPGTYMLKAENPNGSISKKFIKM